MKDGKILALLLALVCLVILPAGAENAATTAAPAPLPDNSATAAPQLLPDASALDPVSTEGVVLEITEDGILYVDTALHGELAVQTTEQTVWETDGEVSCGDYIYIDYDGKMTRSIPAQITASTVRLYRLQGPITEYYAEENALLMESDAMGAVYVRLPEAMAGQAMEEEYMLVYFNGVMTLSLPGQINAGLALPGYSVQGAVTQIEEGKLVIGEGTEAIEVHYAEGMLPEALEVGAVVRVFHDGQMTRSIPAQVSAMEIVQLSR